MRPRSVHALRGWLAALIVLAILWPAAASVFEPRPFASAADEQRYKALIEELRCLVCQNQNIAASDADLARDLRDRVYAMINEGRSDAEIVDFMVQRYGDFVLYRPPLKASTVMLWAGPFALGCLALTFLVLQVRRASAGRQDASAPLDGAQRDRARQLLGEDAATDQERP